MKKIKQTLIFLSIFMCISSQATAIDIFHSDDYKTPLVKGEIDVGKKDSVYDFQFENKRMGNHAIGISFKKLPEGHYHNYKSSFEADIRIYNGNKLLNSMHVIKPMGAYWGGYNNVGGFFLLWYKVPNELPSGVPLHCTIKISKEDSEFVSNYGKGEFFIIKVSDE
jgi:hypothetical protein